jgi:GNAT superfamily N-acetyltransferase
MLIYEYKLDGTKQQYAAIDEAIRIVQFIRNKCLRWWMDGRGVSKNDLQCSCAVLARAYPFANNLNSQARQAAAALRGRGYGKQIIQALQDELPRHGGRSLLVGTANAALENIAFYQKCGFRMYEIRRDYFAYIQPPVLEHGILLRDMLVLRYDLE